MKPLKFARMQTFENWPVIPATMKIRHFVDDHLFAFGYMFNSLEIRRKIHFQLYEEKPHDKT